MDLFTNWILLWNHFAWCVWGFSNLCMNSQLTTSTWRKDKCRCCAKSPTLQTSFNQYVPVLINCTGVIRRWGLPLYTQNAVRWLASLTAGRSSWNVASFHASVLWILLRAMIWLILIVKCFDVHTHACRSIWGNRMNKLVIRCSIKTFTKNCSVYHRWCWRIATSLQVLPAPWVCVTSILCSPSPQLYRLELLENLAIETGLFLI